LFFLILIFITAVTPVLSDQRGAVLRQGGHVLSRFFRYYVPDFSGKVVVQTPITVRWVFNLIIFLLFLEVFCGSGCLLLYCCFAVALFLDETFDFLRAI
jgi:hypothetical protein